MVTNTVMLFFTFRNIKTAFGLEAIYFLMFLVVVEHLVIAIKLIIKFVMESTPDFVSQGKRERA